MRFLCIPVLVLLLLGIWSVGASQAQNEEEETVKKFTVYPIGWVRKAESRSTIVVD